MICAIPARAGSEGTFNTSYGHIAGLANTDASTRNTFIGAAAGPNTTAGYNTMLGHAAGFTNTSGDHNTYVGESAGYSGTSAFSNSFFGTSAGYSNDIGFQHTFIGYEAGHYNSAGASNTYVGAAAGYYGNSDLGSNTYVGTAAGYGNVTGDHNVFLGTFAGSNELGSNKLYIDTCWDGGLDCPPLIYGEFDNHLLKFNGALGVRANGVAKSQMHFSQNDTDTGGWLTSVLDNNFFVSSGARYDATAGGWLQRSSDGNAVMAGSGGVGYRILTHTGSTVGNSFTPTLRLHVDYNGQFGINSVAVAGHEIHASSGAHLTSGGVWTDASSREYKENVLPLTAEQAMQAVAQLVPVTYNYKADSEEKHVGFIAEDVPELVATKDRRSLSPMDIVAALTKVVQEQKQSLEDQKQALQEVKAELALLKAQAR